MASVEKLATIFPNLPKIWSHDFRCIHSVTIGTGGPPIVFFLRSGGGATYPVGSECTAAHLRLCEVKSPVVGKIQENLLPLRAASRNKSRNFRDLESTVGYVV